MCGIAGSYQIDPSQPGTRDRIDAALACIAHRGPDDEGVYRSGRAVLGHRRLSIIDTTTAGHQPFTDNDGRFTIIFNGEVFNFLDLRKELEAQGHTFRSRTDTEVVLRLFITKGPAFLHELNGFFALAIHDAEKDELFIARDRFGVKPLLWCEQDGHFLFASEIRALEALGAVGSIDTDSLWTYFRFHYIPGPHSIRSGVSKLPPGHAIAITEKGSTVHRWYDLDHAVDQARGPSDPEPGKALFQLLDDAVKIRLISDVPFGTFLSGGLDSSIISALAKRHAPDLRTFSIGYADDPFFDETRYAEEVAAHIGSDHTTFKLTREELATAYSDLLSAIDEPFADSSALPSYILCRRTREHVTVALSGDGADEVFGGYRKHQAAWRMHDPGFKEKAVLALGPLWRSLPKSRNSGLTDRFRQFDRFANAARMSEPQRYLELAAFEDQRTVDGLTGRHAPEQRLRGMTGAFERDAGPGAWLRNDLDLVLPNDMLHKVDLTSMAHGLEVRTPFLDKRVVELAFSLSVEQKFRRGVGKAILRDSFGHLLPASILSRSKKGFEVPLRDLFLGPLRPTMDSILTKNNCENSGLSWPHASQVVKRLGSSDPGASQATVHALIVYITWWEHRFQ